MPQPDSEAFRAAAMIVARNGPHSARTGHDHETARRRDRSQPHRGLDGEPPGWVGVCTVGAVRSCVPGVCLLLVLSPLGRQCRAPAGCLNVLRGGSRLVGGIRVPERTGRSRKPFSSRILGRPWHQWPHLSVPLLAPAPPYARSPAGGGLVFITPPWPGSPGHLASMISRRAAWLLVRLMWPGNSGR